MAGRIRRGEQGRGYKTQHNGTGFAILESACRLRLEELPVTTRLANVASSMGAQTLGDLIPKAFGTELLQWKNCGWRTLGEIRRLLERAISGEFDEAQIRLRCASARLVTAAA
jgi:hypothetical protein